MSIKVVKHGSQVRILEFEGDIPDGIPVCLYTKEELEQAADLAQWVKIPLESREDMMLQTQSKAYEEWMAEDEWEEILVQEDSDDLSLDNFKP